MKLTNGHFGSASPILAADYEQVPQPPVSQACPPAKGISAPLTTVYEERNLAAETPANSLKPTTEESISNKSPEGQTSQ
ncbi:hypothetical protein CC1G_13052 [Coprinopsis cinerea okayama7|uniref:Uncharacterized protein n=1 Tax=Coprinopsis cinerea (strain Okayama-7 / 130 / ATCC MYA-4618 / FGSC 9003) TaxID=240176 RepID=A8PB12_COPC7|nr:hypothetical protein CC1G_13052 [Coprinopsis cinerea okayama7\|eukprot:XP_001840087.1 hypothetical protein CC1G_13052 [Coprinopsis cinerea okayama7\